MHQAAVRSVTVVTFSHPDYTVGSGLGLLAVTGSTAYAGHGLGRYRIG